MDQAQAPLFEKLVENSKQNLVSFHVPGHKWGRGIDAAAAEYFEQLLKLDATEISGLDDLHHAQGIIQEAQQLAAQCFGAEESFFLVNGSTVGNLAMILSTCQKGDLLIVQRDMHKSVLHGLMLAEARAVFVSPSIDPVSGLSMGVSLSDMKEALQTYPQAKGVCITNPSYYGLGTNITSLAEIVHQSNKVLLVDEAHGAHFGFHGETPPSALSCGADMVVQSTHKMLTAMTMGAMLHVQGQRINREAVRKWLAVLQSSSPSYPIMASLDLARKWICAHSKDSMGDTIYRIRQFIEAVEKDMHFEVLKVKDRVNTCYQDPFKVIIKEKYGLFSGYRLQQELESRGCMIEMADPVHVLIVFSVGTIQEDLDRLYEALNDIFRQNQGRKQEKSPLTANGVHISFYQRISQPIQFSASQVVPSYEETEKVPLANAVNRKAANMLIPYPPGIPILFPGETISEQVIEYLQQLAALGAKFQGSEDIQNILIFT